jgi:hypothetical protein
MNGFLVVLKDGGRPANPEYGGLYRTPPFLQQQYNRGFDDPYLSDKFVNDAGLIPSAEEVHIVLDRFSEVYPRSELEVLWVEHIGPDEDVAADGALGVDIASLSPFWSILADIPEAFIEPWRDRLNEHGLFDSAATARAYRSAYRDGFRQDREVELHLWSVQRAEP